jgi:hypothetical protein
MTTAYEYTFVRTNSAGRHTLIDSNGRKRFVTTAQFEDLLDEGLLEAEWTDEDDEAMFGTTDAACDHLDDFDDTHV